MMLTKAALRVVSPPKRGTPADHVVEDFLRAVAENGQAERIGVPHRLGRLLARAGRSVPNGRGRAVITPMMGATFDVLYGATLRGTPVPVAWDVWEPHWQLWERHLKRLRLPLVAVTSQMSAEHLAKRLPDTRVICLPEATCVDRYDPGTPLTERSVDILELGRKFDAWHEAVRGPALASRKVHLYEHHKGSLVFDSNADMLAGFANTKVSVCFPSSVTHPSRSGSVRTMTHRYLESIASGCLVLGGSVPELTALLGFDPVIAADMSDPWGQVADILTNIEQYEALTRHALDRLQAVGSWSTRAKQLVDSIEVTYGATPGTLE